MPDRAPALIAADVRTGETCEFIHDRRRLLSRRRVRARTNLVFGPGFCDLQCNGYAGVDFNRRETEPVVIAEAIRAMWEHGCTEVLPTFITAAPDALEEFIGDLIAALAEDAGASQSVPGFHLEGPFINPGACGAHPVTRIRRVSTKLWRHLQTIAQGRIRLVTLAPEGRGALDFIRQLRTECVLPALGHTLAGEEIIAAAAAAGAMLATHLGNGCPQQMHRHANPVLAQLGEDRIAASFIADGVHLPPGVLRSFWRAKAPRGILVTDAMAAAGAPPGRYSIGELELEVGEDRIARPPGSPHLAGSTLTMDRAVSNLVKMARVPLAEAWEAASVRPWRLLQQAGAVGRKPASLVIAGWRNEELKVMATLRGKKMLWAR